MKWEQIVLIGGILLVALGLWYVAEYIATEGRDCVVNPIDYFEEKTNMTCTCQDKGDFHLDDWIRHE